MTYFAQDGAMHGYNGLMGHVPPAPVTAIVCDDCARETIPWEIYEVNTCLQQSHDPERFPPCPIGWRQARPWKWAPTYGGADTACRDCGRKGI